MHTEPYQQTTKNTVLIAGLAVGIVGAIFSFISIPLAGLLSTVATVGILVWGMKQYRDKELGGYMSFGKGFGFGLIVALIGSFIKALAIYFNPISEEKKEEFYNVFMAELENSNAGLDEQAYESVYSIFDFFLSPFGISSFSFFMYLFWGFVVSLVVTAILNRKNPENY